MWLLRTFDAFLFAKFYGNTIIKEVLQGLISIVSFQNFFIKKCKENIWGRTAEVLKIHIKQPCLLLMFFFFKIPFLFHLKIESIWMNCSLTINGINSWLHAEKRTSKASFFKVGCRCTAPVGHSYECLMP